MKKEMLSKLFLIMAATMSLSFSFEAADSMCTGAMPPNDMRIPVGSSVYFSTTKNSGISKEDYGSVLEKINELYSKEVSAKGGTLVFPNNWRSPIVNAQADRLENEWIVKMHGGLARHPVMTVDGFALIACHELGHHLGGAVKNPNLNRWSTAEGGADYYAAIKCFRKYAKDVEADVDGNLEKVATEACANKYQNQQEQKICLRTMAAGAVFVKVFTEATEKQPSFATPDPYEVKSTRVTHPEIQCRLDTFFQGALCDADVNVSLDDKDYHVGSCTALTHTEGLRPRCWFKPKE